MVVASRPADGDWPRQIPDIRSGAARRPLPRPPRASCAGRFDPALDSAALRGERELTVYQPPGAAGRCRAACWPTGKRSGGSPRPWTSAIKAGAVPPVLLVGVHNAPGALTSGSDLRAQEYLPGLNRRRFDAHLRFVTGEVLPWAGERFGPVDGPWVAAGFSNGAAWAIAAAQRRPDLFGAVAAFSAGVVPSGSAAAAVRPDPALPRGRHARAAVPPVDPEWAERLARAGLPCRHEEWVGGHDPLWWERQLPVALGWLLASPASAFGARVSGCAPLSSGQLEALAARSRGGVQGGQRT